MLKLGHHTVYILILYIEEILTNSIFPKLKRNPLKKWYNPRIYGDWEGVERIVAIVNLVLNLTE